MDCSLADHHQQQQQQQQQHHHHQHHQQQQQQQQNQQNLNSINFLDETIKNLTNLAAGVAVGSGGGGGGSSTNNSSTSNNSSSSNNSNINNINNNSGSNPNSPLRNSGDSHQLPAACSINTATTIKLRKYSDRCLTNPEGKSHTYRISMANLEETQESELDVILGELSLLEAQIDANINSPNTQQQQQHSQHHHQQLQQHNGSGGGGHGGGGGGIPSHLNNLMGGGNNSPGNTAPSTRSHSRTNSTTSGATSISLSTTSETNSSSSSSGVSENGLSSSSTVSVANTNVVVGREPRTESPDNDSAFSDTVSLLSSESSASSSLSSAAIQKHSHSHPHSHPHPHHHHHQHQHQNQNHQIQQQHVQYMHQLQQQEYGNLNNGSSKAAKIQLALHKLESATIRRLFVKAFTSDGASKSLLVDERMSCGHVTRMLADKNHVQMQSNWALVESLGDLQMERIFEDHELLVDNLMTWNSDAGNRVLFQQRNDKVYLFQKPELFLPGPQMAPGCQHDEHTRAMLLEEFFDSNSQIQVDGPLYMKADSKKGWKRYHFVLKSSGLYYFPKEKTKNTRDLACLTLFNGYNIYKGVGWKKKWKAPTDYTFGFKSAVDSSLGKTCRTLKMLCAEDMETMEKWITAIRISKYGKQLWENYKTVIDDLTMCDGLSNASCFAVSMRSESISSISSAVPSQCGSVSSAISSMSNSSSGRISRASSSSSSGCLSDDNNAFDSEFTTGTIKRKPSMKPNLPLTSMTRQLKEVGENVGANSGNDSSGPDANSPERSGTLTRRHTRRKSQESNGSNGGTLKRRPANPANLITTRSGSGSGNGSIGGGGGGSIESMNNIHSSGGSSNSTPTPTPSSCAKSPLIDYEQQLQQQLQHQHQHQHQHQQRSTVASSNGVYGSVMVPLTLPHPHPLPPPSSATTSSSSKPPNSNSNNHPSAGGLGLVSSGILTNDLMSSSTLSLDSLPPPPPPIPQHLDEEHEIYGSQLSLASLPPPPPPEDVVDFTRNSNSNAKQQIPSHPHPHPHPQQPHQQNHIIYQSNGGIIPPAVPAKPIKPAVKSAPPYKDPPLYSGPTNSLNQNHLSGGLPPPPPPSAATATATPIATAASSTTTTTTTTTTQKKVSFADSPVLLRRKMCSPEPSSRSPSTPTQSISSLSSSPQFYGGGRIDFSRLSNNSSASAASTATTNSSNTSNSNSNSPGICLSMPPQYHYQQQQYHPYQQQPDFGSPKRLQESASNPPRDFLKDLQRVMRKKWQVAQKCKLEPATTPHEVLGFRDFSSEDLLAHNLNASNNSHYYRETANVSNWVQEHYGAGATPISTLPITNEYALYENVHDGNVGVGVVGNNVMMMMEPQFPHGGGSQSIQAQAAAITMAQRKKRPPPPPPKRSDSTHLTHRA